MEPPIEGYVSPQGVGPIGFEMQAMEGEFVCARCGYIYFDLYLRVQRVMSCLM